MQEAERLAVAIRAGCVVAGIPVVGNVCLWPQCFCTKVPNVVRVISAALDRHDASAGVARTVVTDQMVDAGLVARRAGVPSLHSDPPKWMTGTEPKWSFRGVSYPTADDAKAAQQREVVRNVLTAALSAAPPAAAPGPSAADLDAQIDAEIRASNPQQICPKCRGTHQVSGSDKRSAWIGPCPDCGPRPLSVLCSSSTAAPDLRAKLVEAAGAAARYEPNGWSAHAWKALAAFHEGERR